MNAVDRIIEYVNRQCEFHSDLAKKSADPEMIFTHTTAANILEKLWSDLSSGRAFEQWEGSLIFEDHISAEEGLDAEKSIKNEQAFIQWISDEFFDLDTDDHKKVARSILDALIGNLELWDIWAMWLMSCKLRELCHRASVGIAFQKNQGKGRSALPVPSARAVPASSTSGLSGLAAVNAAVMINQMLPNGVRLGSANRHQLQDARMHFAKNSVQNLQKAYWVKLIAAELKGTQVVQDVLTDKNLQDFFVEARSKATNALAPSNGALRPLFLESQS